MTQDIPVPRFMRAAILSKANEPLLVADKVEIPPLNSYQVLVKIHFSGICQSQLMECSGGRGPDPWLPHLLGHEAWGTVLATGREVSKVHSGDTCVLTWIRGEGLDGPPPRYRWQDQDINAGGVTTFNEYAVVSENRVIPCDESMPGSLAWLLGCALPTGAGMVLNTARPGKEHAVAVFGLGGVGLSALMGARLAGVGTIFAVDVEQSKLDLASRMGAHLLINSRLEDPLKVIQQKTGGLGVDFAFEASGIPSVIELAFASVRRGGGRCIFASHPKSGSKIQIDPYELICGKSIEGSWGGGTNPDRDIKRYLEFYRQGKLPLELLGVRGYPLERVNDALNDLRQGLVSRAFLCMNHG